MEGASSPSSYMESCSHPSLAEEQSRWRDLSTELRLGLSQSNSTLQDYSSDERDQLTDWPPIKTFLKRNLAEGGNQHGPTTFFVKVYMEGIPIGRKLDLLAHNSYDGLIRTLRCMFKTTILCLAQQSTRKAHVLTYEDKEGDWMMVGDVPWELFLTNVKRLKISRADNC